MAVVVAATVGASVILTRPRPEQTATFTCGGPADPGWPAGPFEVAFQANTGSLWSAA